MKYYVLEYKDVRHWYKDPNFTIKHRELGPAEEHKSGTCVWYENGKIHKEDGPAAVYGNGTKTWMQHGVLHRLDGPAIEEKMSNGTKTYEYYIYGKHFKTKKDYDVAVKKYTEKENNPSCDGKVVTIDGKKYKLTEVK